MAQVSKVLRQGVGRFFHMCPACIEMHPLPESWQFDGNLEKPTFSPSFRQSFVRWSGGTDPSGRGIGEKVDVECHYIITAGNIHFCGDSWHKRTDVVAMVPLERPADFEIETQD